MEVHHKNLFEKGVLEDSSTQKRTTISQQYCAVVTSFKGARIY